MVIAQPFTHTLYTEHNRSTIGSALIITYRSHYRHTVSTIAILPTTHGTRSDRAKCDPSAATVAVIVGR